MLVCGDTHQQVTAPSGADDHLVVDHDRAPSEHGDLAHIRFVIDQRADALNEVVLLGLLPPLLYTAALQTSLVDFNANRRVILLLSVGLVIATTVANEV